MNCNVSEKTFELGERRRVTLKVWLNDDTGFSLSEAAWTLFKGPADTEESQGACVVTQQDKAFYLVAEVQPLTKGLYRLQYSFNVATEIIKRSVTIKVV